MALFESLAGVRLGASLFVKKDGYLVATIPMDILVNESHTMQSEVAQQPIESGSIITTHIRNKLRTGSLTGLISNWSLRSPSTLAMSGAVFGGAKEAQAVNRVRETYNLLVDLWEKKQRIRIVTTLWEYFDVAITSIEASRDGESGDAQEFTITFQELNVIKLTHRENGISVDASLEPVAAKKAPKTPTQKNACGDYNVGQAATTTTEATTTTTTTTEAANNIPSLNYQIGSGTPPSPQVFLQPG